MRDKCHGCSRPMDWGLFSITRGRVGTYFLYSFLKIVFCTHRNDQLDFVVPTEILHLYFGMDTTDLCLLSIVPGFVAMGLGK